MKLIELIKNYARQENTDFAILINGSWGSGKTYFLKKIVANEIKQINCKLSDKENKPYELVYVSLYGLTSADELQKILFLEMNPLLKTKVGTVATLFLTKTFGRFGFSMVSNDEKKLINIFGGIPKNKILVFDDLERLAPDTFNEVLGFINTYTEHQNLKVIIIADEEKIWNKISDYEKVKEKLIRFTYLYNPELEEVYTDFVGRYSSQLYPQYLTSKVKMICDLFEKGRHKNLRSLRFLLDLFENIFNTVTAVRELNAESKDFILNRYLFFMTTYSIEHKKGGNDKYLDDLKSISINLRTSGYDIQLYKHMRTAGIKKGDLKEKEFSDSERFIIAFEKDYLFDDGSNFEYFDFLATYVHSGDLDYNAISDSCTDLQEILNSQKVKPEQIAFHKLPNSLKLNDDELLPLVQEIYRYVDAGIYFLEQYPIIFQNFYYASLYGISNLMVDDSILDRFKEGMKKSLKISKYRSDIRRFISLGNEEGTNLEKIRDYADELNFSIQANTDKQFAEKLISSMVPGSIKEFLALMVGNEVRSSPIFQEDYINPEAFLNQYNVLSNKEKLEVNEVFDAIGTRFELHKNLLKKELSFYQKVNFSIEDKINKSQADVRISTYHYKILNRQFNKIVSWLNEDN